MKTAISIPDKVFALAEQFAKQHKITRSSLFTAAVDEYIHHHREEGVTQMLDEIYNKEDSVFDPALAQCQSRSLPREEWSCGAARSGGYDLGSQAVEIVDAQMMRLVDDGLRLVLEL